MSTAIIHPSRLAAPSSGEWSCYTKPCSTGPSSLFKNTSLCLFSLWTIKCFIVWLLGPNEVISVIFQSVCRSIYSIFFFFSFFFFFFSFSWIQKEKKNIFIFNFYWKYFYLIFSPIFFSLCNFFQILFYFHHFILVYFGVFFFFKFSNDLLLFSFLPLFSLIYQAPFNTQTKTHLGSSIIYSILCVCVFSFF